jgi:hypothetical protein
VVIVYTERDPATQIMLLIWLARLETHLLRRSLVEMAHLSVFAGELSTLRAFAFAFASAVVE